MLFAFIFVWASIGTLSYPKDKKVRAADSLTADSVPLEPDTTQMDSLQLAIYKYNKAIDDSIALDSANRRKKNGIDAPVHYVANDSLIYEGGSGMAYLYGDANVKYEDMDLKSEEIYMCLDSSLVHARGGKDSTGVAFGIPVFVMGKDKKEND